jgi:hypothetical protein
MGDSLNELLGGLIAFTGYNSHVNIYHYLLERYLDDDNKYFKWAIDQEGSSIWFLFDKTNEKGIVKLRIIENYEKQECVFNENIILDDLIKNIIFSCQEILKKNGIIGYYMNFWKEFPIAYYLMLSDYLKRKLKINSIKENIDEKEEELFSTDVQEEMNYIIKS